MIDAKTQTVMELIEIARSGAAARLPVADQQAMAAVLADAQIERYMIPSKNPGVYGNPGASPKQLTFMDEFKNRKRLAMVCTGSNQCASPDSLIDTPDGPRIISEINEDFIVYSWNGRRVVSVPAVKPQVIGYDSCVRLTFDNGLWFECSLNHRLLTIYGWLSVASIVSLIRTSSLVFPAFLGASEGVAAVSSTSGSMGDYRASDDLCDAPPPCDEEPGRFSFPLQGDVLRRSRTCWRMDDLGRTREYIHCDRQTGHGSIGCCASHLGFHEYNWSLTRERASIEQRRFCLFQSCQRSHEGTDCDESSARSRLLYPYLVAPNVGGLNTIVAIESIGSRPIYDFHVPVLNNYVAGGVVHHNSGKTIAAGLSFCRHLRDDANDGDIYWMIAQSHEAMRKVPQQTLWDMLPRSMFGKDISYTPRIGFGTIPTVQLSLPHNRGRCAVVFKTEEADLVEFESERVSGVWYSESTREAVFHALQPRLVAKGGWIVMDYLPVRPWHRELRIRYETGDPTIFWRHFTIAENAHNLSEGSIEKMRMALSEQEWRLRGLGMELTLEGLVYPQFSVDRHVIAPFKIPEDWPRWRILDYGFAAPTACLWATVAPIGWDNRRDETLIVYREYHETGRSVAANAQAILMRSSGEQYARPVIIDPSAYNKTAGNPDPIANQYDRAGLRCMSAPGRGSTGTMDAQVEMVRKALEDDRLVVFKTCVHTIREFQVWQYKRNRDGQVDPSERYENGNDHCLDCCRYWIATRPCHTHAELMVNDDPGGY